MKRKLRRIEPEMNGIITYGQNIDIFRPGKEQGGGRMKFSSLVKWSRNWAWLVPLILVVPLFTGTVYAADAREIDVSADVALEQFMKEVGGAGEFLGSAKGYLVFPKVVKAGLGIGGEYGEGALRIAGKTVAYYSTASASIGLQLGVQKKSIIIVFMTTDALSKFRKGEGWEVGVDGSVALIKVGAGGSIDSTNVKDPIVAFIFGQKGLMYNLTLEGSKFTKLEK
jgi:lipid-binding SYLF domain-containing protein